MILSLLGCAQDEAVFLQHAASLETATTGLVMSDDGQTAEVAFGGRVQTLDVYAGMIGRSLGDWDGTPVLLDARADRDLVVAGGVHLADYLDGSKLLISETLLPLRGRLTGQGAALLFATEDDDCGVALWSGVGLAGRAAPEPCGSAGFAVDPVTELAWIATGEALLSIGRGSVLTRYDLPVDEVGWDALHGLAVVANRENGWVAAMSEDGRLSWAVAAGGSVGPIAVATGLVIVSVERPDGGYLLAFDTRTGDLRMSQKVPSAPTSMSVSAGGDTLALSVSEEAHFFGIESVTVVDHEVARQVDVGERRLVGATMAAIVGVPP